MPTELLRPARRAQRQQRSRSHVIDQVQSDLLVIMVLLLAANLALTV
jgi:hypothetical protein